MYTTTVPSPHRAGVQRVLPYRVHGISALERRSSTGCRYGTEISRPKLRSTRILATAEVATKPVAEKAGFRPAKPTLFDTPLSNNGARCRYIIYKKGLEAEFDIVSPMSIGGLKCPEYLEMNPMGLMPLLVLPDGTNIYESEVIAQYLLDKYQGVEPTFLPATPEKRIQGTLATRILDQYINSIQGCMYKPMDIAERGAKIEKIAKQLDVLEGLVKGPYFAGELTCADGALFPTFAFMDFILPQFFGWEDIFKGRPGLKAWWMHLESDPEAVRVINELRGGLEGWKANERWEKTGIAEHVKDTSFKWAY